MLKINGNTYILSENDLKELWNRSWVDSKGMDKNGSLETDYREKCFNDYILKTANVLMEQEKIIPEETNPKGRFVLYGDTVTNTLPGVTMENEKDGKVE